MDVDDVSSITLSSGVGFFAGILLGYALKKVIKIAAIIIGLFIAGLDYLQHQQIASINWNRIEQVSEGIVITLANTPTLSGSGADNNNDGLGLAISEFSSMPFTIGSMSAGFTIGFLKG
jgi:uncharacterized membrane protein (Fun14 family)